MRRLWCLLAKDNYIVTCKWQLTDRKFKLVRNVIYMFNWYQHCWQRQSLMGASHVIVIVTRKVRCTGYINWLLLQHDIFIRKHCCIYLTLTTFLYLVNYLRLQNSCWFFYIFLLHLTAFFRNLILTVVSHDLHKLWHDQWEFLANVSF